MLKDLRSSAEQAGNPEGIEEHMQYPRYRQAQWPIGSGIVESGHRVVMQARLKGAGMRLRTRKREPDVGVVLCSFE